MNINQETLTAGIIILLIIALWALLTIAPYLFLFFASGVI